MSLARSILTFCIDISPSMGAKRLVEEEVAIDTAASAKEWANLTEAQLHDRIAKAEAGDTEQQPKTKVRTRETTDLQWVNEFVAKKVQNYVLAGLKTARIHLLLFGSPRTDNTLLSSGAATEGYEGIDEIMKPDQPDVNTLEVLRCLRAAEPEEKPHKADPLDAIVAAVTTLNSKEAGGIGAVSKNTWRRTIYLLTDAKTSMNKSDWKSIRSKLLEDNIALKIVGIDFDDPDFGFVEENKDAVKEENEAWWHHFLSKLPGSGIATAANVIAQAKLPAIQLQSSVATPSSLTLGDPESRHEGSYVLDIPVNIYKCTATARPMGQKRLSKIAQDSAAARTQMARMKEAQSQLQPTSMPTLSQTQSLTQREDGRSDRSQGDGAGLTYGVQMVRRYYIKEDMERLEGGMDNATPLPEGAEETFDKAYKLGASLVAVNQDLERSLSTMKGLEIIQFTNAALYRRQYHMGETFFVFPSPNNARSQLQLSSLIRAMSEQNKYAIVRFVRRNDADPKLGILAPAMPDPELGHEFECFYLVEVPFREDIKRFTFPPLDRVVNREGKELTEHSTLPSKEMRENMDELVDSMDLMDAEEGGALDGDDGPWFLSEESFNPAIHLIKDAVSWRVFHPDDKLVPKPHPEVEKFLERPHKVVERSRDKAKRCRELFDLEYVPTVAMRKAARKAENQSEGRKPKEVNLEGVMDEELAAEERAKQSQTIKSSQSTADAPVKNGSKQGIKVNNEERHSGSDTEEEEELGLGRRKAVQPKREDEVVATAETRSTTFDKANAIADFETRLEERGAELPPVFDGMEHLIKETISKSFSSNDYSKARDYLKALRKAAVEYEEAPRYNDFLRAFKKELRAKNNRRVDFWNNFVQGVEELSLITDEEDTAASTSVTRDEAEEFVNM
ncbi:SPOC domain-like protein [Acaromyces ingoldii]|uniref:ATP-dependent DNA helicase II subunit 2 n=1 Tax=Acaromyces ingoldii TaxID=215250 RepID=A0A316YRN2_9BASI|nr:SPOC domain-like protein [Acaromyces ingoldii]PWN91959.1 SPOC domain-like protein [Acaromyces ingoldii]